MSASRPLPFFHFPFFSLHLKRVTGVTGWTERVGKSNNPARIASLLGLSLSPSPVVVMYWGRVPLSGWNATLHICVFPLIIHVWTYNAQHEHTRTCMYECRHAHTFLLIFCFLVASLLSVNAKSLNTVLGRTASRSSIWNREGWRQFYSAHFFLCKELKTGALH